MFSIEEIRVWEEEQMDIIHGRYYPVKNERPYDPFEDRLKKRRKNEWCSSGHFWRKENKFNQLRTRRGYRKEMNRLVRQGKYENIRPFQNTSGWETW